MRGPEAKAEGTVSGGGSNIQQVGDLLLAPSLPRRRIPADLAERVRPCVGAFARSRSGVPSGLYGLCTEDAHPHCSRIFIRAFSSFFAVAEGSELKW